MYSIVTPKQFCGLMVDCFPYLMRPAPMVAVFVDGRDGGGGQGGEGGEGGGGGEE
jgi:hypothetical protein